MTNLKEEFNFPVIRELSNGFDLVAHPNGPMVMNEHTLATLRVHSDYDAPLLTAIMEGQDHFNEFAFRTLKRLGVWPE